MVWSATITSVEYHTPVYRCVVLLQKGGVDMDEEVMDIEDTKDQAYIEDIMRDMIHEKEGAESLGVVLNNMVNVKITGLLK